ncbi:6,7-dimethyl-8-ribityllumazine synthase [Brackiella oedipodis]|uniref:6,7-dimethyl-8-ribityllumazine synthase n=1 Tax=Brackiella oedipodis TaxID=124225 RepID=UPI00048D783A|nr:6,7-dimethyl-8-ribityllumazine synthase [Brackiella oedipodis]
MKPYTLTPDLRGEELHIGIVCARFNEEVMYAELEACLQQLADLGVDESNIMVVTVPGALECGLALYQLADTCEFDALIALGAVIRGETYHFEIVSNESAAAITRIGLEANIPIANGILTTETTEQAQERAEQKGQDCAICAVEMANLQYALVPEPDEDADDADLDEEDDIDDEDFDDDEQ